MSINIGEKIKEILDSKGLSKSEFGRRLHMSREGIYGILRRKTIDTELLESICEILDFNFFELYRPGITIQKENEQLKTEISRLQEENRLLKDLNELLKQQKAKTSRK